MEFSLRPCAFALDFEQIHTRWQLGLFTENTHDRNTPTQTPRRACHLVDRLATAGSWIVVLLADRGRVRHRRLRSERTERDAHLRDGSLALPDLPARDGHRGVDRVRQAEERAVRDPFGPVLRACGAVDFGDVGADDGVEVREVRWGMVHG